MRIQVYLKRPRQNPEAKGSKVFIKYLESKGWYCAKLGGGKYTVGWPDYYCYHPHFHHRWLEMKAKGGKLRSSQIARFKRLAAAGDKVYVIEVGDDKEKLSQYAILFADYDNWRVFIRNE